MESFFFEFSSIELKCIQLHLIKSSWIYFQCWAILRLHLHCSYYSTLIVEIVLSLLNAHRAEYLILRWNHCWGLIVERNISIRWEAPGDNFGSITIVTAKLSNCHCRSFTTWRHLITFLWDAFVAFRLTFITYSTRSFSIIAFAVNKSERRRFILLFTWEPSLLPYFPSF